LLDQGKLNHGKYLTIITHGEEVLSRAGLVRPPHAEREARIEELAVNGKLADWGDWRLQIGRKKYEPLYSSEEEWLKAYSEKFDEEDS